MQPKKKECDSCKQDKIIWKNYQGEKFCLYCWNRKKLDLGIATPLPKPEKPIKPVSDKQKDRNYRYRIIRDKFLDKRRVCEADIQGRCLTVAVDVHHMDGRIGDKLFDTSRFLAVCRLCHQYIEDHPTIAKELGFSGSRLEPYRPAIPSGTFRSSWVAHEEAKLLKQIQEDLERVRRELFLKGARDEFPLLIP